MGQITHVRNIGLILLLAFMSACAATEDRRSTGEYLDDQSITTKVRAALASDRDVSVMQVGVQTFRNTVLLSGFVNDEEDIQRAVEIAQGVRGVDRVEHKLEVREGKNE